MTPKQLADEVQRLAEKVKRQAKLLRNCHEFIDRRHATDAEDCRACRLTEAIDAEAGR